jgi:excisionase family DNA binding protein
MVAVMDGPLTTSEAARIASVSEGTIRLWLRSGRLPHQPTKHGALISPLGLAGLIAERERRQREKPRTRQVRTGR